MAVRARKLFAAAVTGVVTAAVLLLGGSAAYAADPIGDAKALQAWIPDGNNWSCQPSAAHPYPVVLVHGTSATGTENWFNFAPKIAARGYCVYALNYGNRGLRRMEESAPQLATFVRGVLAATGAAKVDIVGHSQGGLMPRYYLKNLGGAAYVDELISMGAPNHGTSNVFAVPVGVICHACPQFAIGSDFLTALNSGGDTVPGVRYTNITTRYDELVTPHTSAFLTGDPALVTNVRIQDTCRYDLVEHIGLAFDKPTLRWILNALARSGPADPGFRPTCW
ncbi:MAG: esterase/lipase family protein [Micromonosporaceae bacterium]